MTGKCTLAPKILAVCLVAMFLVSSVAVTVNVARRTRIATVSRRETNAGATLITSSTGIAISSVSVTGSLGALSYISMTESSRAVLDSHLIWKSFTGNYNITSSQPWGINHQIDISQDGQYATVGSNDKLYLFDMNGDQLFSYPMEANVISTSLSADGNIIAGTSWNAEWGSNSYSKYAILNKSGGVLHQESKSWEYYFGTDLSADGNYSVTGNLNANSVYLFQTRTGATLWTNSQTNPDVFLISEDGKYILSATWFRGPINAYNRQGSLLWSKSLPSGNLTDASVSNNGISAIGSDDDNVYIYDSSGNLLWNASTNDGNNLHVAISNDSSKIIVGSNDQVIRAYSNIGAPLWTFPTTGFVHSVSISGNGSITAAGCTDGKIEVLNASGSEIWNYQTGGDVSIAISKDGNYLIASSKDGNAYFFSIESIVNKPPTGLVASPGNGQILLSWSAPTSGETPTNYNIYRSTSQTGTYTKIASPTTTSYTDIGLTNGQTYWYKVSAQNSYGFSVNTSAVSATPSATGNPPGIPTGLTTTPGNTQVSLSWTTPTSGGTPTNYNVYRSTSQTGTYTKISSPTSTSYTDTGLTNGQTYWYKVNAQNTYGFSANTSAVSATPFATSNAPGAPMGLTASPGNAQVLLSWTAPTTGGAVANYNVLRSTSQTGTYSTIASPTTTTYTDTGLTNGQTYWYEVNAQNSYGISGNTTSVSATPSATGTPPGPPTGLVAIAGNAQATLSWNAPASGGVANYNLYRSSSQTGTYTRVVSPSGTTTTYTDTGLTNGNTYWYKVNAQNVYGFSTNTTTVSVTPSTGSPPETPTGLTAVSGNAQVALRWTAPTSGGKPTHYNIYRSDSQTGIYMLIASPNTTQYKDIELKNGHKYWYEINAQDLYGVSGNTTAISATPDTTNGTLNPLLLSLIIVIIVVLVVIVVAMILSRKKKAKPGPAIEKGNRAGLRSRPGLRPPGPLLPHTTLQNRFSGDLGAFRIESTPLSAVHTKRADRANSGPCHIKTAEKEESGGPSYPGPPKGPFGPWG